MYLQQYRNMGIFYETATNRILDDLVAVLKPRKMTLPRLSMPGVELPPRLRRVCRRMKDEDDE